MKKGTEMMIGIRWKLTATACCLAIPLSYAQAQANKPTCAVLTFDARAGVSTPEAQMLSDRFATEFARLGQYTIVARSRMREVLDEQQFQATDHCSAAACAVEAGQLLGVRYMVYGTIGRLGQIYSINSFIVDVETGAQIKSATSDLRGGIEEALTALMARNAHELLGIAAPATLSQSFFNIGVTPNHARLTLNNREIRPGVVAVEPNLDHSIAAALSGYHPYSVRRRASPGTTENIEIRLEQIQVIQSPSFVPSNELPRKTRDVYLSPRVGASMATGLAGIEVQVSHLAASIGVLPDGFAWGVRFYFKQDISSWFLGVCGVYQRWDDDYFDDETTVIGAIAGYRWRSRTGWEFSLGAGIGQAEDKWGDESFTETIPMIDLALGYAF